jgi:hypothetical protein
MPYQTVSLEKVDHVMVIRLNDIVNDPAGWLDDLMNLLKFALD